MENKLPYIRFGVEWETELNKWTKKELIAFIKRLRKEHPFCECENDDPVQIWACRKCKKQLPNKRLNDIVTVTFSASDLKTHSGISK